jgi:hypothetical protein
MGLIRIVYYSERDSRLGLDMRALLDACNRNNTRDDIGGFLHYNGHYFLQALEGEQDVIVACYRRIAADQRHMNLVLIGAEPIDTRSFGLWSMGVEAGHEYPSKEVFAANFATSRVDPDIAAALATPPG